MLESIFDKVADMKGCNFIKKRLQHSCFSVEFTKFLSTPSLKNICKRMLLKPVLSPGLNFLIIYTSGSNWHICFSFYIIIYSFICQFFLHYYRYCYNQKQSSGGILHKRCSYKFRKILKKMSALKIRF